MAVCFTRLFPAGPEGSGYLYINLRFCSLVVTIYYRSFFGEFFWVFCIQDHVICEQRQFHFFLFTLYSFRSFGRTGQHFQCRVQKQWREGHPCVVPGKARGQALSFSPVSLVLAVRSLSIFLIKLRKLSLLPVY